MPRTRCGVAVLVDVLHCSPSPGRLRVAKSPIWRSVSSVASASLTQQVMREADVHNDVIADVGLRHVGQAGLAYNAIVVHLGHAQRIALEHLVVLSRECPGTSANPPPRREPPQPPDPATIRRRWAARWSGAAGEARVEQTAALPIASNRVLPIRRPKGPQCLPLSRRTAPRAARRASLLGSGGSANRSRPGFRLRRASRSMASNMRARSTSRPHERSGTPGVSAVRQRLHLDGCLSLIVHRLAHANQRRRGVEQPAHAGGQRRRSARSPAGGSKPSKAGWADRQTGGIPHRR